VTAPPTVSGDPSVGATLMASAGSWSGNQPISYSFQWQYCKTDMSSCSDIGGYTDQTYRPVLSDAGGVDRVKVTARNESGSSVAYSQPTSVITDPGAAPASRPSNTVAPSISGTLVVGSALTAAAGSWSGDQPISFGYQWKRCDLSGANCAAITGAISGSYITASADQGLTLRVTVTATNAAGSATTTSAATATVAGSGGSGTGGGADFDANPNVTGNLVPWDRFEMGTVFGDVASQPNGATSPGVIRVTDDPLGQQGKVYQETVCATCNNGGGAPSGDWTYLYNFQKPYFGIAGADDWVHFRVMFPGGGAWTPTQGEWNVLHETHNDSNFLPYYNAGQQPWEVAELTLFVLNYAGDVPRLAMRVKGGQSATPPADTWLQTGQVQTNHWYDVLYHVRWSPTSTGVFEWWLDGQPAGSVSRPTLWQRPDGSLDHPMFEQNNYRLHQTYDSTVYYGRTVIGPTQASVGF
jgi:hypothetical protein